MRYVTFYYDLLRENVSDLKVHEDKEKALKHFNSECYKWFELGTKFKADKLPATYGYLMRKYYGVSARTFKKMFDISIDEAIKIAQGRKWGMNMTDIELVIKISDEEYDAIKKHPNWYNIGQLIANGTPLPKGHGKIVDISKIDDDRIESDNPVIYLTINGEYIEAVSLDYLNSLPTIIEADKAESEE